MMIKPIYMYTYISTHCICYTLCLFWVCRKFTGLYLMYLLGSSIASYAYYIWVLSTHSGYERSFRVHYQKTYLY